MNKSDQRPKSILAAQALFFLNAAIWLVFGIVSIVRIANNNPDQVMTAWIIAVLMLGNVVAMLLAGFGIGRRERRFFYFALAVLAVNILLTFTDEFGVFDLVTLVIDIVLLGILIAGRKVFMFQPPAGSEPAGGFPSD